MTTHNIMIRDDGKYLRSYTRDVDDLNQSTPIWDEYFTNWPDHPTPVLFEYNDETGRLEWWPEIGPAPHWSIDHSPGLGPSDVVREHTIAEFDAWFRRTY